MDFRQAEAAFEHELLERTTLSALFEWSAERHATGVAQRYKGGVYARSLVESGVVEAAPNGEYAELTYSELRTIVRHLAAGFRDLGVDFDDRLSIAASTRMEWAHVDLATLAAGGVVTTVYPSVSDSQLQYLLTDPEPSGVVVENAELLAQLLAVEADLDLDFIVVIDSLPDGSGMAGAVRDRDDIYTLGEVYDRGAAGFDVDEYDSWVAARAPEDLASLIYTSGTTGQPKGVQLSHENFRANINQAFRRFGPRPDRPSSVPVLDHRSTTLSFLPLAHVFERLVGHFLMLSVGATVAYAESPETLKDDFQLVSPTCSTSVPRVYEKLYRAIQTEASGSALTERIFEWAVDVGQQYHHADDPGRLVELKRAVADRLVFSQVRAGLGGDIDFFISGGGSLSAELCALYHGMGIPIFEGYGLTETAPVISVNPPEAPIVGTIGPPLFGVETRLDRTVNGELPDTGGDVGELLVRGPNVTAGYWNDPEATQQAFVSLPADGSSGEDDRGSGEDAAGSGGDDGDSGEEASERWFRTGDIVEQRADDYIVFRERAKQLLVLSTGKNVAPAPIESAFAPDPVVEQCLVVGDGQKFVSALIVPDFEGLARWATQDRIDLPNDHKQIVADDRVRQRIQSAVDAVNDDLEPHEQIKRFRLLAEPFSTENNLLTPTMKKKRRSILDRYTGQIEGIYTAKADR